VSVQRAVYTLYLIAQRDLTLKSPQEGVEGVCDGLDKGVEAHQFMGEEHCQWSCSLVSRLGERRCAEGEIERRFQNTKITE
jgi:hypothetical protein